MSKARDLAAALNSSSSLIGASLADPTTYAPSEVVGGGVKEVANTAALGTGSTGDQKFVTSNKSLYVYDGSEWDRINAGGGDANPVIVTDADSSLVAANSIDSHRRTYKVVDPEGFPMSYSISYMRDSDKIFFTNDSSNLPPPLAHPTIITTTDGTATYKFLTRTTESDGNGNSTKDLYKARYMGSDGARHAVSTKNFRLSFIAQGVAFTNNPTTDPFIAWTSTGNSSKTRFGIPANSAAEATAGVSGNGGGWQYKWPAGNVNNWQTFNSNDFGFIAVSGNVTWNGISYNGFFYSPQWTTGNSQYSIRHVNHPTSGVAGEVDHTDENQGRTNDAGNVTSYFTTAN